MSAISDWIINYLKTRSGLEYGAMLDIGAHDPILSNNSYAFEQMGWSQDQLVIYGKTGSTRNSLFAGYARAADGRCLALAVLVENDNTDEASGSKFAAPLARNILQTCGELNYLPAAKYFDPESP